MSRPGRRVARRAPGAPRGAGAAPAPEARIRKGVPRDAAGILGAHREAIRGGCAAHYTPEQIAAWTAGLDADRYREAMARMEFLVADAGGRIAGFAVLDPAAAELHALYVAPGHAGRGLGRTLLGAAERIAAAWGLESLRLKSTINAAGFYERQGYVSVGQGINRTPAGIDLPCIDMVKADLAVAVRGGVAGTAADDPPGPAGAPGPHPEAPPELALFAFLVGRFRCESRVRRPGGPWTTGAATRHGRYILGGRAIADTCRQVGADGAVTQHGINIRSYDATRRAWVLMWFDALGSTWLEMGPADLGGVRAEAGTIAYLHRRPQGPAGHPFPEETLFRNTFHDITAAGFAWRADVSGDGGRTWDEVQAILSRRL